MIGLVEILRKHVVSERKAARVVSLALYGGSLAAVILGIRGALRLAQNEKEIFFGVILVMNCAMIMVLGGFMVELVTGIAPRHDKPDGSAADK